MEKDDYLLEDIRKLKSLFEAERDFFELVLSKHISSEKKFIELLLSKGISPDYYYHNIHGMDQGQLAALNRVIEAIDLYVLKKYEK